MQVAAEDGRVARRLENRTRIIDALFALVWSGALHPTLQEIAAKAQVTPRTLFNHFPDMSALITASLARGHELAKQRLPKLSKEGDAEERALDFFRRAAEFYDGYSAIRWALLTQPRAPEGFDRRQRESAVLALIESRISELFQDLGCPLDRDQELRRAVLVMADPLAWRLLRVQQGLSRAQASASMARGIIMLARGAKAAASKPVTARPLRAARSGRRS